MAILVTTQSEQIPGPELVIDCPKCGATGAWADSYEQRDQLGLFFVVPLFGMTNTFVRCGACGARLTSRLPIANLERSDVSAFLFYEISIVIKFLAVASILLCLAPIVGLVLAACTVLLTRRSGGWPRTLGMIALLISCTLTIAFAVLVAILPAN